MKKKQRTKRSQPSGPQRPAASSGGARIREPAVEAKAGKSRAGAAPRVRRDSTSREAKYYGRSAVAALFAKRPQQLIRVYLESALVQQFAELLAWCAKEKLAYHIVEREELDRVSASTHHEGICVLAQRKATTELAELLNPNQHGSRAKLERREKPGQDGGVEGPILFLEGVGNPHNLGSILRLSAHFGVTAVIGVRGELPATAGAAGRVAEGGLEHVRIVEVPNGLQALQTLQRRGWTLVATSSHAERTMYEVALPEKSVFLLGSEGKGLSRAVIEAADVQVAIPGTGLVESLNVATAAGILLSEWARTWGCVRGVGVRGEI